jgi:hypothetical protein
MDACIFEDNQARNEFGHAPEQLGPGVGGGMWLWGRGLITNSEFRRNTVDGSGGAMFFSEGIFEFDDNIVEDNEAPRGGGIQNSASTKIRRTLIQNNVATRGSGGGILAGADTQIYDSTIAGNESITSTDPDNIFGGTGGGIYVGGIALIDSSTVVGNIARLGGGIYNIAGVTTLLNSTISGNVASERGGGVFLQSNKLFAKNTTITENDAPEGAGVYISWHPLGPAWGTFNHSIIGNNFNGGLLDNAEQCRDNRKTIFDQGDAVISIGYNILSDQSCNLNGVGDLVGVDPLLGPLALNDSDNSGPTMTHLPLADSPAINGGATGTSIDMNQPTCLPKDQRGIDRPKHGGFSGGIRCDIGAVELKGATEIDLPEVGDLDPVDEIAP